MKKYLIGFVPAILLALVAITYITVGNKNSINGVDQNKLVELNNLNETEKDSCCMTVLNASDHSENSIYNLTNNWIDENENSIKLKKFEGKRVVLAMVYTSCPTACPVIVNNMKNLESAISQKERNNYHFVLVSIDPERDTPKKLNSFAFEKNLDTKTWTLLTGSKNSVAELAELIGFKYKKNANGTFTHSNLITFLDNQGVIINQCEGLNQSSQKLIAMLDK